MRPIVVPIAIALSAVAFSAHAEPTDSDRATARALAHQGYEAQQHQQFALAADRFERAEALVHAPTLLLGLARAEAGMGKLVEASETYRRIVREPLAPHAPDAFAKAVSDAKKELANIEPRLAWVTVTVLGAGAPAVTLDDLHVDPVELGVPVVCNPGTHVLTAAAPGFEPQTRTFGATEGSRQTIAFTLTAQPQAVSTPSAPIVAGRPAIAEPQPQPSPGPGSGARTVAEATAFVIGGVGLAAGAAAGVYTLVRHHTLDDECPGGHCAPGEGGALSTYRTIANVSTIATIVGAAGIATGVTLALTSPKDHGVEAYAGPFGAGITGRF